MAKAKTTIKKITQNAWECTKIFKTGEIEKRIVKDTIFGLLSAVCWR